MVLVCVTTFKGHHKIQDRWENREYVVEKQSLSQCTSLCGMPQGWAGAQVDPTKELFASYQLQYSAE